MNWQQFLTEKVLGECYHEGSSLLNSGYHYRKCDKAFSVNRTFDNRNDLMDLYEAVNRDEKIWQFEKVCWEKLKTEFPSKTMEDILNLVTPWMFCLDGKGYEERCRMAAEFYGWNEQRDPVIDKNSGAYGDN